MRERKKEFDISMQEFIDKLDTLCYQYGFQIWATDEINKRNKDGSYPTFTIHKSDGEKRKLVFIDGDGGGK